MIDFNLTTLPEQITFFIQHKKSLGTQISHEEMAKACRVHKSYFSKVMSKQASLSEDQLFLLLEFLNLDEIETQYMRLIHAYEKSAIEDRKKKIMNELLSIQILKLRPQEKIKANTKFISNDIIQEYYLNPWHQIVHMALTIPKYRKNPKNLIKAFNISENYYSKIVSYLIQSGIIKVEEEEIIVLVDHVHLNRDSAVYWSWKTSLMNASLEHLKKSSSEKDLSFNLVFSADKETFKEIRKKMLTLISEIEAPIRQSKEENLYQLNFDLFSWD